jgi:hypothetical protein
MPPPPAPPKVVEVTLAALLLSLLLLLSPLRQWWAALHAVWYAPYLIWVLVILLGAALQAWLGRNEPPH